jgi:hypothetical protein
VRICGGRRVKFPPATRQKPMAIDMLGGVFALGVSLFIASSPSRLGGDRESERSDMQRHMLWVPDPSVQVGPGVCRAPVTAQLA